ncbi:hypothetical protein [Gorillibacterium sp. sgz500922]|uniref:hypothetical protein n=1 Tax=Gorillibacterium sp. sgz500922 TaxID=3446694 RepID=UPI003F6737F3
MRLLVLSWKKLVRRTVFLILFVFGTVALHALFSAFGSWSGIHRTNGGEVPAAILAAPAPVPEAGLSRLERLKLFYTLGE